MEDYKPNSYLSKSQAQSPEEKKKIEKAISGKVERKEHSKLADIFIQEDIHNVGNYLFFEVMVPAAKKMIADVCHYGVNMWLFGRTGDYDSKSSASKITYSPYHKYYERDREYREPRERARQYGFDDIYFSSYGEADTVLDRMFEIIEQYNVVTVADYYELAGETGTHTDNKWGWTSLKGAEVLHTSGGNYKIRLPRVSPID